MSSKKNSPGTNKKDGHLQTYDESSPDQGSVTHTENDTHNSAYRQQKGGIMATKSLGRSVGAQLHHYSSEEESDDERDRMRGKIRSLGRKEMHGIICTDKLIPVSERSAAYKEMVSSSITPWKNNSPKSSPRHSTMNDGSLRKSKIESNPFFQLDKKSKTDLNTSELSHKNSPPQKNANQKLESSSIHTGASPVLPGMSVQMRIKIWTELTEKESKAQHRKSLPQTALMQASKTDDEEISNNEGEYYGVQSDDETIKNKMDPSKLSLESPTHQSSRPVRENVYEEIDDKAKRYRIEEASSSSSAETSPFASPSKTLESKLNEKEGGKSPKSTKKKGKHNGSSDAKQSRSIWKLRSPLGKRKGKNKDSPSKQGVEKGSNDKIKTTSFSRKPINKKKGSLDVPKEEDYISDEVFSPNSPVANQSMIPQAQQNVGDEKKASVTTNQLSDNEELPTLFDKTNGTKSADKEGGSVSHDILNIIHSLGTIEENCVPNSKDSGPTIRIEGDESDESDPDSDSEDNSADIQSSLDANVCRQDLKRRASGGPKSPKLQDLGRKGSLPPYVENAEGVVATPLMYADAVWDRTVVDSDELSFRVGDVIEILDMTDDVWWHGNVGNSSGWFPASFVRLRVGQNSEGEEGDSLTKTAESSSPSSGSPCSNRVLSDPSLDSSSVPAPCTEKFDTVPATLPRTFPLTQGNSTRRRMTIRRRDPSNASVSRKLSPEEVRAKIIEEIINTERDYVKHLEDIIEGFLKRCREFDKLFDDERIEVIFSNIEEVFKFQRDFYHELQAKINMDHKEQSEIGSIFVLNQHEFKVYSQYCNNHPHAVNEMNLLQENEQYALFFESCRLLRNLQDISLEGFLLTPVQKICKYPLQLSELLKYTSEDHPDYPHVVEAQQAMKEVAMLINEQKRRIENMGKIGCWQKTIDGWKGPDILETSTEQIHSGELHKISKGHSQERHFFLFDHQLIYCKKDAIGGRLGFKGRLNLDDCQIADLPDGSAMHGNTPVKNGWRMNNIVKDKWYIIYAKSVQEKEEWMAAFQRERERVKEDEDKRFHVSLKMKRAAVSLCASTSEEKKRVKTFHKKHVNAAFGESSEIGGTRKQAVSVSGTSGSSYPIKKGKSGKKKLNSVSGTLSTSTKVIQ